MNRVINSFINTVKKIKSEIFGKISDFIFLYVEKIKSEIFVPFGHRIYRCFDGYVHLSYRPAWVCKFCICKLYPVSVCS